VADLWNDTMAEGNQLLADCWLLEEAPIRRKNATVEAPMSIPERICLGCQAGMTALISLFYRPHRGGWTYYYLEPMSPNMGSNDGTRGPHEA
jgi:hypothetical protein